MNPNPYDADALNFKSFGTYSGASYPAHPLPLATLSYNLPNNQGLLALEPQRSSMASVIMNVIKEEAVVSATSVASVTSTAASASRSTISRSIATCAPSARAAVSHAGAESAGLLAGAGRQEVLQAVRTQPVLGNLSTVVAESPIISSVLGNIASSESTALRHVLPELREQMSNAVQQGFGEALGDQMPRLEPTMGIAETAKQLEEIATR